MTTVGKRVGLWLQDLIYDYKEIVNRYDNLELLGTKGATGTQASFLQLFEGDSDKVKELDNIFCEKLGYKNKVALSGQTYPRKIDYQNLSSITGLAISAGKFSNDIRLLQHTGEMKEGFTKSQIGSSAMPYKRNPIHSERIFSLARFAISLEQNAAYTASNQWFERTLDDSANRRIVIPEIFLTVDAILLLYYTITKKHSYRRRCYKKQSRSRITFYGYRKYLNGNCKKRW